MVTIVDSMEASVVLMEDQLTANATLDDAEKFANETYSSFDILLGSIVSWQELPNEVQFKIVCILLNIP